MPLFARPNDDGRWLRPELVAPWSEIAGVLLALLAPFVAVSAWAASRGSRHHYVQLFLSDRTLLLNGATEGAILGLALVYLHRRGWKPADLRIRPTLSSTLQGIVLVPITMFANGIVVFALFWLLFMQAPGAHGPAPFAAYVVAHSPRLKDLHAGQLSWPVLIVAMILNAFLEEIICTAYAFCQFAARNGPAFAVLLTVVLRAACHTYQGAVHACGIGVAFLIYALWYWRTRNLWTLIVAHALLDLTSLSAVKIFAP